MRILGAGDALTLGGGEGTARRVTSCIGGTLAAEPLITGLGTNAIGGKGVVIAGVAGWYVTGAADDAMDGGRHGPVVADSVGATGSAALALSTVFAADVYTAGTTPRACAAGGAVTWAAVWAGEACAAARALSCAGTGGGGGNSNRSESSSRGTITVGSLEAANRFGSFAVWAAIAPVDSFSAGAALCITGNGSPG